MTPGCTDPDVVDRHLVALRRTLAALRRHAGVSPRSLRADSDRRWAIERGLQLCALVHGYLDVDLDLICGMLAASLDDFEEFARHVERWLAGTAAPTSRNPRST